MNTHFSNPFTFGAIPRELSEYKKCKVVILPVPYDGTVSYRPGARDGPHAIIQASRAMELYDEESGRNFAEELGICTLDELEVITDPEAMANRVVEAALPIVEDGKHLVTLDGVH